MTRWPILGRSLRLRRRSLLGWSIATAAFSAMIVAVFPVVRDDTTFDELLAEYPEPVQALMGGEVSLSSGAGFMSAEMYSLVLPVLVAVLGAGAAASLLAGEDERGWLSLVVSGPTTRRRVVVETFAAVAAITLVPAIITAVVVAAGDPLVEFEIGIGNLVAVTITTWIFGSIFGAVALAVGAAVGRRAVALGAATGLLLFAYAAEIVGTIASWGRPVQELSPFHHLVAAQPLIDGMPWVAAGVAIGVVVALVEVSARLIVRRDLIG